MCEEAFATVPPPWERRDGRYRIVQMMRLRNRQIAGLQMYVNEQERSDVILDLSMRISEYTVSMWKTSNGKYELHGYYAYI